MIKKLNSIFIRGLIVVLPVSLTIFVMVWLTAKMENLFAPHVKTLLGDFYFPGFGILITFLGIFLVGILVSNFITGRIISFFTTRFEKLPVVKAIYRPLRDFISLLGGSAHEDLKRVVILDFKEMNIKVFGLVTRDVFDDIPNHSFDEQTIAVYIPFSYFFGGITLFVPRSIITEVDIPADMALRSSLTGWIKNSEK